MASFKFASAGVVTLGVGLPCLRKRVTLVGGTTYFYPCKQFVSANRGNFLDERMRNKTFKRKTTWRPLLKRVTVLGE